MTKEDSFRVSQPKDGFKDVNNIVQHVQHFRKYAYSRSCQELDEKINTTRKFACEV